MNVISIKNVLQIWYLGTVSVSTCYHMIDFVCYFYQTSGIDLAPDINFAEVKSFLWIVSFLDKLVKFSKNTHKFLKESLLNLKGNVT